MDLLPLTWHIKAGNWERYSNRLKLRNYSNIKDIILKSFEAHCAYCGYQTQDLELVNKDFDYHNNVKSNIVPACRCCLPCVLLDGFGRDPLFKGKMIYLPELTQVQLNHFMRALYAAIEKNPAASARLKELLISFDERREYVAQILGKNSYEPEFFSQGLMDILVDSEHLKHPVLKSIRFLPDFEVLKKDTQQVIAAYFP
jgi:hypothetical protein